MIYASIFQFALQAFWHGLFVAQYPRFNTNRLEKQHVGCFQCFKVSNHGWNSLFVSRCFTLAWYEPSNFLPMDMVLPLVRFVNISPLCPEHWYWGGTLQLEMNEFCSHESNSKQQDAWRAIVRIPCCNVDFCKQKPSQVKSSPQKLLIDTRKAHIHTFENPLQQKNKSDPLNSRHPESSQDLLQSIMFDLPKMRRKKREHWNIRHPPGRPLHPSHPFRIRPQKHEFNLESWKEVIL